MEKAGTKTADKNQGAKKNFIDPVWKKCRQIIDFAVLLTIETFWDVLLYLEVSHS